MEMISQFSRREGPERKAYDSETKTWSERPHPGMAVPRSVLQISYEVKPREGIKPFNALLRPQERLDEYMVGLGLQDVSPHQKRVYQNDDRTVTLGHDITSPNILQVTDLRRGTDWEQKDMINPEDLGEILSEMFDKYETERLSEEAKK